MEHDKLIDELEMNAVAAERNGFTDDAELMRRAGESIATLLNLNRVYKERSVEFAKERDDAIRRANNLEDILRGAAPLIEGTIE